MRKNYYNMDIGDIVIVGNKYYIYLGTVIPNLKELSDYYYILKNNMYYIYVIECNSRKAIIKRANENYIKYKQIKLDTVKAIYQENRVLDIDIKDIVRKGILKTRFLRPDYPELYKLSEVKNYLTKEFIKRSNTDTFININRGDILQIGKRPYTYVYLGLDEVFRAYFLKYDKNTYYKHCTFPYSIALNEEITVIGNKRIIDVTNCEKYKTLREMVDDIVRGQ